MKKIILSIILSLTIVTCNAFAETPTSGDIVTYKDLRNTRTNIDTTPCASAVLANALSISGPQESSYDDDAITNEALANSDPSIDTSDDTGISIEEAEAMATDDSDGTTITDMSEEDTVRQWVEYILANTEVLEQVLACPEISLADEDETIKFTPIKYTFPDDTRELTIYYETQPKVLRQKLLLAQKRVNPAYDPNPHVGENSDSVWVNTIPAWYAIAVVQSTKLDNFVGPGKNNTVSARYIEDNITELWPDGSTCTSKSALANDDYKINKAVTATVDFKGNTGNDDPNDYYVAGDANLQWITYLEIAADIVMTVITWGGWAVALGATKVARAAKAMVGLSKTMRTLRQTKHVKTYIKATRRLAKLNKNLKKAQKAKNVSDVKLLKNQISNAKKTIKGLERSSKYGKDVRKYKKTEKTFRQLSAYRNSLRLSRLSRRGNLFTRGARAVKAVKSLFTGGKLISRGARMGRTGSLIAKSRSYLFQSTMRFLGQVAKVGTSSGIAYTGLKFLGNMYDWSSTSNSDYTSGIDFKPFLLLSADDIPEQGNVVNHGMWLMWLGDSVNMTDDDAAYLQAMDFASKFHEELMDIQDGKNSPCNVDIFVVRPIIRNPGTDSEELYYLFMNDIPWTTNVR